MKRSSFSFPLSFVSVLVTILMIFTMPSCDMFTGGEKELVTEHEYSVSGSYRVLHGYLSGSTSPSISVNLADPFNLKALAKQGYVCDIVVRYRAQVNGDHLNLRCSFSGVTNEVGSFFYMGKDENSWESHASYNISGNSYTNKATLYVKWECEGMTFLDGINDCTISNITVEVKFSK